MVINLPVMAAGAAVGVGVVMMVAGWIPRTPDLRATITRIHTPTPPANASDQVVQSWALTGGEGAPSLVTRRIAARLATTTRQHRQQVSVVDWPLVRAMRVDRLAGDLALLGETVEQLLVRKAGYMLLGLLLPTGMTAMVGLLDLTFPWPVPTLAAVAAAAGLFFLPDYDVVARARTARAELRRAVCLYIELVALERAADAGVVEALERAADLGQAPAFTRIRQALTRARLDGDPPWAGLRALAAFTGIAELSDLADIMATSGLAGTAVYTSLRARATSLRTAITTEDTAAANAASERMVIPVACLGLVFMALIAYPALSRIALG